MFGRRRKTTSYGPYPCVGEVDITGLSCGVRIVSSTAPAASVSTEVFAQGGKITVSDTTMPDGRTWLELSDRGSRPGASVRNTGSIRQSGSGGNSFANTGVVGWPQGGGVTARNTGDAVVSGGGYANTGIVRTPTPPRSMKIPAGGFVRNSDHRVQVTLTVPPGTVVIY